MIKLKVERMGRLHKKTNNVRQCMKAKKVLIKELKVLIILAFSEKSEINLKVY